MYRRSAERLLVRCFWLGITNNTGASQHTIFRLELQWRGAGQDDPDSICIEYGYVLSYTSFLVLLTRFSRWCYRGIGFRSRIQGSMVFGVWSSGSGSLVFMYTCHVLSTLLLLVLWYPWKMNRQSLTK